MTNESENPPNCTTCPNTYEDDLKGFVYCSKTHRVLFVKDENGNIVDRNIDWRITGAIGCIHHPETRAWINRDLIAKISKEIDNINSELPTMGDIVERQQNLQLIEAHTVSIRLLKGEAIP